MQLTKHDLQLIAFCAASTAAAALAGSLAAIDAAASYGALQQPGWAPPSWLFGPVWTVLYIAMAIAGFLLGREERWKAPLFRIWMVQLVFNGLWTPLFFAWELRLTALIWILVLDGILAVLVMRAWSEHRTAAILLAPYLAWTLFATMLNASIWALNR